MTQNSDSWYVGMGPRNEVFNLDTTPQLMVDAGAGNDVVFISHNFGDILRGGLGNDVLMASNNGFSNPDGFGETIYGDNDADPSNTVGGDDQIRGGSTADAIFGGGGNDFIDADRGNDAADGGAGDDILWGGLGADTLLGGLGDDTMIGGGAAFYPTMAPILVDYDGRDDTALAVDDNQRGPWGVAGGQQNVESPDASNDRLDGGDGNDLLYGQGGDDTLTGGTGADYLDGGDGADSLDGDDGDDTFGGGAGDDALAGGNGDDSFVGDEGADQIDGGNGIDTLYYYSTLARIVLTLDGANITTVVIGGASEDSIQNIENVFGSPDNDRLTGDSHANEFFGDSGNDILTGSGGADNLDGGLGKDKFVYGAVSDSTGIGYDTVTGFDARSEHFVFPVAVTGIDATIASGALRDVSFDADLHHFVKASKLAAGHAVLFTPTTGDHTGETFLIVDGNGVAGYQAGRDYVIDLDSAVHLAQLDAGDFSTSARLHRDVGATASHDSAFTTASGSQSFGGWHGLADMA